MFTVLQTPLPPRSSTWFMDVPICQIRGKFKFRYRYEVCTYLWVFWRPRTSTDYSEVMVQILLSIEPVPDFLLGITKLGQIRMWTSILGSYFGTASNHRSSDTMEVEVFIKRIWINDKAATWKKNNGVMEKSFCRYFFYKRILAPILTFATGSFTTRGQ